MYIDSWHAAVGGYATDAFEDVGHSTDARELMKKYAIGKLAEVSAVVWIADWVFEFLSWSTSFSI